MPQAQYDSPYDSTGWQFGIGDEVAYYNTEHDAVRVGEVKDFVLSIKRGVQEVHLVDVHTGEEYTYSPNQVYCLR